MKKIEKIVYILDRPFLLTARVNRKGKLYHSHLNPLHVIKHKKGGKDYALEK